MLYEFILKAKFYSTGPWFQICKSVVKEHDFDNAMRDFEKYAKRESYADTLILINKLDAGGNFIEVVQ